MTTDVDEGTDSTYAAFKAALGGEVVGKVRGVTWECLECPATGNGGAWAHWMHRRHLHKASVEGEA